MFKILYAASPNFNSNLQLIRLLDNLDKDNFKIKVAAYKDFCTIPIDWTLDALKSLDNDHINLDNHILKIYSDQVRSYKPDLIISDLEFYTSYIGLNSDIPVWQYSPYALTYAVKIKSHLRLNAYNVTLESEIDRWRNLFLIEHSSRTYINSHLPDAGLSITLRPNCYWSRPYYILGSKNESINYSFVGAGDLNINQESYIRYLSQHPNSILFSTENIDIKNVTSKNISQIDEYANCIRNTNRFVCSGHPTLLADAFYNETHSLIVTSKSDIFNLWQALSCRRFKIGQLIYHMNDKLINLPPININMQPDIKHLDQEIYSFLDL